MENIKNEEAYQNRKCISRGLSEGFIRPVAAQLRTWVAPHAYWLIKVAAVSKGHEVMGNQEKVTSMHACVCVMCSLFLLLWPFIKWKREEVVREIMVKIKDAADTDKVRNKKRMKSKHEERERQISKALPYNCTAYLLVYFMEFFFLSFAMIK